MKNYKLLFVCLLFAGALHGAAPAAACDGCDRTKPRGYDRPYGKTLDTEYQDDYYRKKRIEKESLFHRDLHEDEEFHFKPRDGFDDNQSYLVPEKKKTIRTWEPR